MFDHQAPLTRPSEAARIACSTLVMSTANAEWITRRADLESNFRDSRNFGPGAALRVTRWCLALELAMDKQAARVASAGRVSGA